MTHSISPSPSSGRDTLLRILQAEMASGKKMTSTDELISFYLLSLRSRDQYPTQAPSTPSLSREILRGMFANLAL